MLCQAPAYSNFPHHPPITDPRRVTSNPEEARHHERQGEMRQVNPPIGRFNDVQGRVPQQRYLPSTELLEKIHPGSTNRGNWHSDPASNPNHSYHSDPAFRGNELAIPPRGLPGPYTYGYPPPVSLEDRRRNSLLAHPRGKKNPSKRLSDDARKGGFGTNGRRHSSNAGFVNQFEACPPVYSPQAMQSPLTTPQTAAFQPNSIDGSRYTEQSRVYPSYSQLSNQHDTAPPQYAYDIGQTSSVPPHLGEVPRYVSNPYVYGAEQSSAQASHLPFERARDRNASTACLNEQRQVSDSMNSPVCHENTSSVTRRGLPASSQDGEATASSNQMPHHKANSQVSKSLPSRTVVLEPPSSPYKRVPQIHPAKRPNSHKEHYGYEGPDAWIGNIPSSMDKATVKAMLAPCVGLIDVGELTIAQEVPIAHTYATLVMSL